MFWSELKWNWLKIYYNCHFFFNYQSEGFHFNQCIQCYFCHVLFSPFYTCQRFHIPSWLRSDTVLKWIDTFSNKHTYLKTSCIYLRIVLISISLKFVGPLATRAKWTIIKRGQIIPSRYWVKQQIDIVIIDTPECFNSFSISFHIFVSQWFLIRHSSHLIRNHCRAKMILLIN